MYNKSFYYEGVKNMDKDKDAHMEKQNSVDKLKKNGKPDNLILAVFKMLLGFNYHKMGTKKDF